MYFSGLSFSFYKCVSHPPKIQLPHLEKRKYYTKKKAKIGYENILKCSPSLPPPSRPHAMALALAPLPVLNGRGRSRRPRGCAREVAVGGWG